MTDAARDAKPGLHVTAATGSEAATLRLMMLHGIYGRGRNWKSMAREIGAARPEWSALLVDLRLHGDSPAFEPPHTLDAAAADVRAVIDAESASGAPVTGAAGAFVRRQGDARGRRHAAGVAASDLGDRRQPRHRHAARQRLGHADPRPLAAARVRGARRRDRRPREARLADRRRELDGDELEATPMASSAGRSTSTRWRRCCTAISRPICGTSSNRRRRTWTCTS